MNGNPPIDRRDAGRGQGKLSIIRTHGAGTESATTSHAARAGRSTTMIYRSPYPDLDIPNAPFPTVALRNTQPLGEKPAFIDAITGRTMTYGELGRVVDRAAAGLHQHGVRKRDVVAIFAPNSIDHVIAFYAI